MALSTTNTPLQIVGDSFINPPASIQNLVLVASTAQDITLSNWVDAAGHPAYLLNFACTGNFYVKWNGTGAAVPSVNVTNGTGVELNPAQRLLGGITSMSIVAPADCVLTISIYRAKA